MADFEGTAREQLERVLVFLGVSGGAALVSKANRSIVARSGEVDALFAVGAVDVSLATPELLVHLPPDAMVCDVGESYRLVVRVGAEVGQDAGFAKRIRRARNVLERFVLPHARPPVSAPPGSTPAHAAVYALGPLPRK